MKLLHLKTTALLIAAALLLSGCGLLGCGGSANNSGAFGGCQARTTF